MVGAVAWWYCGVVARSCDVVGAWKCGGVVVVLRCGRVVVQWCGGVLCGVVILWCCHVFNVLLWYRLPENNT